MTRGWRNIQRGGAYVSIGLVRIFTHSQSALESSRVHREGARWHFGTARRPVASRAVLLDTTTPAAHALTWEWILQPPARGEATMGTIDRLRMPYGIVT